jgi:hypothetical protein
MGWPDHPLFGQGVASATPYGRSGVAEATPKPLGVVRPPRKPPRKKKKKNEMGLCRWGWPDHPQGPGVASATPYDHTQALRGGPATPNGTKPFRFFFFFFLVAFGVAGPPPKAWGWLRPPQTDRMGWPKPPLGQKGGGPATPFLGKGVALATPDFPFFFFFFFFFSFLLKKKKKKNQKWPKLRRFGQNGVVLE